MKTENPALTPLIQEISLIKSDLIKVCDRVEEVDEKKAESLSEIIARLEAWQNS